MYDENDLQLVGITSDLYDDGGINQDQIDLARDIIDKIGVEYTILIPSQEIQTGLISDIQLYPTTIFVNEKGELCQIGSIFVKYYDRNERYYEFFVLNGYG